MYWTPPCSSWDATPRMLMDSPIYASAPRSDFIPLQAMMSIIRSLWKDQRLRIGMSDEPETSEGLQRQQRATRGINHGWLDDDFPSDGPETQPKSGGDGWLPDPTPPGGWGC